MFQFRRFPAYCYFIHSTLTRYCRAGFPHSEIHGSRDICSSPWLFAACRVLHRLLMPRHSPCALISLTYLAWSASQLFSELCRLHRSFRKMLLYPKSSTIYSLQVPLFSGALCCLACIPFLCSVFKVQIPALRPEQNTQKFLLEYFGPFSGAGGDKRDRTADLLRAKQALSHLSYTPMLKVVGLSGLEPPTLRLSVVRSSQLS